MNSKILGSILMILGTSIGAGMLALPVVTAEESFITTALILFICWFVSTVGALALMELNLRLKDAHNIPTMAELTLGKYGKVFALIFYSALMYSLICAYMAGTAEIVQNISREITGHQFPQLLSIACSLIFFVSILLPGIGFVDRFNRLLMLVKGLCFIWLISALSSNVDFQLMQTGDHLFHQLTFSVVITAFGYAIIVPSITEYLDRQRKPTMIAIILGSALPLLIYLVWIALISGVLPKPGLHGLIAISKSVHTNDALLQSLNLVIQNKYLVAVAEVFMAIAVTTSFLGVSLALSDFIADALHVEKVGMKAVRVYAYTFIPPLIVVIFTPRLFITALSYAGFFCVLLQIIMPLLMLGIVWRKPDHLINNNI